MSSPFVLKWWQHCWRGWSRVCCWGACADPPRVSQGVTGCHSGVTGCHRVPLGCHTPAVSTAPAPSGALGLISPGQKGPTAPTLMQGTAFKESRPRQSHSPSLGSHLWAPGVQHGPPTTGRSERALQPSQAGAGSCWLPSRAGQKDIVQKWLELLHL